MDAALNTFKLRVSAIVYLKAILIKMLIFEVWIPENNQKIIILHITNSKSIDWPTLWLCDQCSVA